MVERTSKRKVSRQSTFCRAGLGIEKALEEIERGRGTAYDPIVADACLRLFRDKGYVIPA
jgi:HD-GYP domain-containing protein (c-di-GMP phosphodiesterase class II)